MMPLHPFLLPAGIVLALIFCAATPALPVWLAQVTLQRGAGAGIRAGIGAACAYAWWAALAALLLFAMGPAYAGVSPGFRAGAVAVLGCMAVMAARAPRLESLRAAVDLPRAITWFTFRQTFWMPMRLPGFLAVIVAINLPLRIWGAGNALLLGTGAGLGTLLWCGFFVAVAWAGRDVPEAICVRSLNKLRALSVTVLLALAAIAAAPFLFRDWRG